jgi:hypothetical protein
METDFPPHIDNSIPAIESNPALVPALSHVHHQALEKQNKTKDERPATNKISQGTKLIVFRNNDIFLCQYIPNQLENLFMRFEFKLPMTTQIARQMHHNFFLLG